VADETNKNGDGPIQITGGDGEQSATGRVNLATGIEQRPCIMCRRFEKDQKRLVEHLLAKGLVPDGDGKFTTPIAKDFPGRKPMKIDPTEFGYCRRDGIITDMMATCEAWSPTKSIVDLKRKI
jgi:hypothetical protein